MRELEKSSAEIVHGRFAWTATTPHGKSLGNETNKSCYQDESFHNFVLLKKIQIEQT